jgi:hypothetical protein
MKLDLLDKDSKTEVYLTEMADIAARIAEGDLTVTFSPRSEKDELGIRLFR